MRRPERRGVWLLGVAALASLRVRTRGQGRARRRRAARTPTLRLRHGDDRPAAHRRGRLPPGHPAVDDGNPHAHAGKASGMPGVFQPPEDVEQEDPTLAPGTIAVDLRDADDHPVRRNRDARDLDQLDREGRQLASTCRRRPTPAAGRVLGARDGEQHRLSRELGYQGGSFAATPFQLGAGQGDARRPARVPGHARPRQQALIVCEAAVAAEVRDDRIQIEEALTIYNLGRDGLAARRRSAWRCRRGSPRSTRRPR